MLIFLTFNKNDNISYSSSIYILERWNIGENLLDHSFYIILLFARYNSHATLEIRPCFPLPETMWKAILKKCVLNVNYYLKLFWPECANERWISQFLASLIDMITMPRTAFEGRGLSKNDTSRWWPYRAKTCREWRRTNYSLPRGNCGFTIINCWATSHVLLSAAQYCNIYHPSVSLCFCGNENRQKHHLDRPRISSEEQSLWNKQVKCLQI